MREMGTLLGMMTTFWPRRNVPDSTLPSIKTLPASLSLSNTGIRRAAFESLLGGLKPSKVSINVGPLHFYCKKIQLARKATAPKEDDTYLYQSQTPPSCLTKLKPVIPEMGK